MRTSKVDSFYIPTLLLAAFLKTVLVMALAAGLGGCGGGGSGGTTGETSPTNQTAGSAQPSLTSDMQQETVQTEVSDVTTAQAGLMRAYGNAATQKPTVVLTLADVGGQALAPGIYQSVGSLDIAAGDLTLDAHGDVQAVWIFQVADMLRMAAGRQIVLRGGAQASNIYWQVSGSVWVGEGAEFSGTLLANHSIVLKTGVQGEGRFFSLSGIADH